MNFLIFLDLTYNPGKNFKFYSLQGQNFKIFLFFTYNQGKVFLIFLLPGGTCIPGLHWELPPPRRIHVALLQQLHHPVSFPSFTEMWTLAQQTPVCDKTGLSRSAHAPKECESKTVRIF